MEIRKSNEWAVVAFDICNINCLEMRQMHELNARIQTVLESHKPNNKERQYISDNDLQLMHAILSVFTKEYSNTQTSAFDDYLKEQDKPIDKLPEIQPVEMDE